MLNKLTLVFLFFLVRTLQLMTLVALKYRRVKDSLAKLNILHFLSGRLNRKVNLLFMINMFTGTPYHRLAVKCCYCLVGFIVA